MSIRTAVLRQASQIRHYRDLPSWWNVLQVAIGVVFVLFIGYKLIAPEPEVSAYNAYIAENPIDAGLGESPAPGTEADPGSAGASDEATGSGATASLALQDGTGNVSVPEEALSAGTAAATALFTTDFTSVPLSESAAVPTLPQKFPNPFVSEPLVASFSSSLIVFTFVVDPDSAEGPEGPRRINVTVLKESGSWGYTGG